MVTNLAERDVSKAVRDLLVAEKIPYWRMNSGKRIGSYRSKKTGKVKNWAIRLQKPGTADLLCAPNISSSGGTLTQIQRVLLANNERLRNALRGIAISDDGDCECDHSDDNCCVLQDNVFCAYCEAEVALRAGRDPEPLSPAANGHNRAWLWIELKAGKRGQTPEQREFQKYVTDLGMFYVLARSSDDVLEWLREHK